MACLLGKLLAVAQEGGFVALQLAWRNAVPLQPPHLLHSHLRTPAEGQLKTGTGGTDMCRSKVILTASRNDS